MTVYSVESAHLGEEGLKGVEAYRLLQRKARCPYVKDSEERKRWVSGWLRAARSHILGDSGLGTGDPQVVALLVSVEPYALFLLNEGGEVGL